MLSEIYIIKILFEKLSHEDNVAYYVKPFIIARLILYFIIYKI